jgi:hypothetical protein
VFVRLGDRLYVVADDEPALFTLGSGATERRERGWLLPPAGEPSGVSLGDVFATPSASTSRT